MRSIYPVYSRRSAPPIRQCLLGMHRDGLPSKTFLLLLAARRLVPPATLLFAGYMAVYTAPLQLTAMVKSGRLGVGEAGALVMVNIIAGAAGAWLGGRLRARLPSRRLAIAALLLTGLGQLVSAVSFESLVVLTFSRFLAGLGGGIAMGLGAALLAGLRQPEVEYARASMMMMVSFAVVLALLPVIVDVNQSTQLFAALGLVTLALIPLVFSLSSVLRTQHFIAATRPPPPVGQSILLFGSAAFYFLACGGGYVFSSQAAARVGLAAAPFGAALSALAVVAIAGSFIAAAIGLRFGRTLPLAIGSGGTALGLACILAEGSSLSLVGGLLAYGLLSNFTVIYLFGLAAAIDEDGRSAAAFGGFIAVPYSIGPLLFGIAVDKLGWLALAPIAGGLCVCGGLAAVALARWLGTARHARACGLAQRADRNSANGT